MSTMKTFGTISDFCKQILEEQENIVEDSVSLSVDLPKNSLSEPSVYKQKVVIEFEVYANFKSSYTGLFMK